MTRIYKCLNEKCGIEFEADADGREHKFHSKECYREMRARIGTKALKGIPAILVSDDGKQKKRGSRKKSKRTIAIEPAEQVKEGSEQSCDKNIIAKKNDDIVLPEFEGIDLDQDEVINFDDLSILELKELIDTLLTEREQFIYQIDLMNIQIEEYQHKPLTLEEAVEEFVQNIAVIQAKKDEQPIAPPEEPKVEIKPRIDPIVELKIKEEQERHEAELKEKDRIRILKEKQEQDKKEAEQKEWRRKEREREKADEERKRQAEIDRITKIQKDAEKARAKKKDEPKQETFGTRICNFCHKEFEATYHDQAFCDEQCAQDKADEIGGVIELANGKGFVAKPLKPKKEEEKKDVAGAPGNGFSVR